MNTAIEPGDGPGLEHVEQPEQHEAGQHPLPASRSGNHGDAEAYHLVPDDGTVIRHADGIGGRLADANARHEPHSQQGDEPEGRQTAHQQVERNGHQGPHGARRPGGETGTKAQRQAVERVLQAQAFQLGPYLEKAHAK